MIMKMEGRVFGCEACNELMEEEMKRSKKQELITKPKKLVTQNKMAMKKRDKSIVEPRKSVSQNLKKKVMLPGGQKEGEPEWWGAGVNRIVSIGPGELWIEEVESNICERTYPARKSKALSDRLLWGQFLKKLQKKYDDALTRSQGPDWFQDLSPRQMGLFDQMNEIIVADIQEGICSRTLRALSDIGIHPPLPKSEVKRCMYECLSNIIRFVFMLHKVLVDREQEQFDADFKEAVKEERTVQMYSINERILLSGVFHLHFDEFTSKLDKLLPSSPEKPKFKFPKKQSPPPKETYKSPYLEPLPIAAKVWYEQRAEDDLYKEQERLFALQKKRDFEENVLRQAEEQKRAKEDKLRRLMEQKTYFNTSRSMKKSYGSTHFDPLFSISTRENKSQVFRRVSGDKDVKSFSSGDKSKNSMDICKSLQHVRKNRRYMYDVVHETVQTKTSYGGFFSQDNKLLKDSEGANLKIRVVPRNDKVVCLYKDEDFKPVQVLDTRVRTCCRDVGIQTSPEPMFLPINVDPEAEYYKYLDDLNSPLSDASTNTDLIVEDAENQKEIVPALPFVEPKPKPKPYNEVKPLNVECSDLTCALISDTIPMNEYDMMRRKIETYPPEKQLRVAVVFLCRRGDPLAVLPKIEETPWLTRWYERRRGIKVKMTKEEKDELLLISQKLWSNAYNKVSNVVVKPFRVKKHITTLDKEWLMKKINKYKADFHCKLRQQMVNNARDYFPTLLIEYFNSPLNKTLRKTFFTYLPSRELDMNVYKVWAQEAKERKAKES